MADLKEIYRYIALDLKAVIAAKNQTSRIREGIKGLALFPERFAAVEWEPWNSLNVRKMPMDHFVVYYRVVPETLDVEIIRIFYGGRDIENIINGNDTPE